MVMTATIMSLFSNNLNQSKYQEEKVRAYYLALSGIELGYASLLTDTNPDENIETLFMNQFIGTGKVVEDTLGQAEGLNDGTVKLTIMSSVENGDDWINITAVGKLTDTDISSKTHLKFLASNPAVIIRDAG